MHNSHNNHFYNFGLFQKFLHFLFWNPYRPCHDFSLEEYYWWIKFSSYIRTYCIIIPSTFSTNSADPSPTSTSTSIPAIPRPCYNLATNCIYHIVNSATTRSLHFVGGLHHSFCSTDNLFQRCLTQLRFTKSDFTTIIE